MNFNCGSHTGHTKAPVKRRSH